MELIHNAKTGHCPPNVTIMELKKQKVYWKGARKTLLNSVLTASNLLNLTPLFVNNHLKSLHMEQHLQTWLLT